MAAIACAGTALQLFAAPSALPASVDAVAAGALLTMIADTVTPEAAEGERGLTGCPS